MFVDYEHGLNAAITRIRQALGDSAERPRYVETAARKGYRFIAPVEEITLPEPEATPPLPSRTEHSVQLIPGSVGPRTDRKLRYAVAAVIGVVLTLGIQVWSRLNRNARETKLIRLTQDSGLTMDPAVSADGKLLAYVSDRGNVSLALWVQQLVPGGTSIQLTHDDVDAREPAFSPDGSKIVFRSEKSVGGVYIVPSIGGPAVQVVPHGRSPRFSPDGKWISYWVGENMAPFPDGGDWGSAYIVSGSGGEPKRIAADLPAAAYPVWAPDSRHLLVYVNPRASMPARDQDWWVVSRDGTPSQRTGAFAVFDGQGIQTENGHVPRASHWTDEGILFAATLGDATNSWRLPVRQGDWRATVPAQRLTSGTTLEVSPLLTRDRLFFASINRIQTIWALEFDTNRGVVKGVPKRLTHGGSELTPSISADGRYLAFTSIRTKNADIWIKDLATGGERAIADSAGAEWRPRISSDGTLVAYTVWESGKDEIRTVPASGGVPKRITAGSAWVWWLGNTELLFKKRFSDPAIEATDLTGRKQHVFVEKVGETLFQASFSTDRQWLVVEAILHEQTRQSSRIFVVPMDKGTPAPEGKWSLIGDEDGWNDKPRWSIDGNVIYFVSHRDGFRCLWAQRLNPKTKEPVGQQFGVYHFHNTRLSMMNVGLGLLEIDVAKDKLVFNLAELTGNIWSMVSSR
jgi:Tol biopolymer transport system component